jgi:hypothetical protein
MNILQVTVNIYNQINDIAEFHMTLSYKTLCLVYKFMFFFHATIVLVCIQVLYGL